MEYSFDLVVRFENPPGHQITLKQLLCHRLSGLYLHLLLEASKYRRLAVPSIHNLILLTNCKHYVKKEKYVSKNLRYFYANWKLILKGQLKKFMYILIPIWMELFKGAIEWKVNIPTYKIYLYNIIKTRRFFETELKTNKKSIVILVSAKYRV